MPENGRLRRTSARLTQNGTSTSSSTIYQNGKRTSQHAQETSTASNKKRKVSTQSKEDKLSDIIVDFNLAVNELYQLKEYKSIISWDPIENSSANDRGIKAEFGEFVKNNDYRLVWDKEIENNSNIDSLPLRFQKKKLAEQNKLLDDKFSIRQNVLASKSTFKAIQSHEKAGSKLKTPSQTSNAKTNIRKSGSTTPKRGNENGSRKQALEDQDEIIELSDDSSVVEIEKNLEDGNRSTGRLIQLKDSSSSSKIINFDPTPLEIIQLKDEVIAAPKLTEKLQNFLNNDFKTPIIDESNVPDYNFTRDEYNTIMSQQEKLLRKLYHKVNIENSLELNDPFRNTFSVKPKLHGAANNATHQDYLLAQGMAFSKVHQQMRKQHHLRTRKIAAMIDQHFKKKKGEKERLAKEREQNLKKMSRLTMQAVKKRWNQAQKVYQIIQNEKEEELKKIKGRQHLSEMLEHSTQLLEAQLTSSREPTVEAESDDNSTTFDDNTNDSDNFSSSEEEENEEDNTQQQINGIKKLRKKYADLETSVEPLSSNVTSDKERESETSSEDAESSDDDDTDVTRGLASLYQNDEVADFATTTFEYSAEEKKLIEDLNQESDSRMNSLLDSDSVSSFRIQYWTASLFTNGTIVSDEEDDVSISSNFENESDESMNSSDRELEVNGNGKIDKIASTDEDDSNVEIVNGSKVKDVPIPSLLRGTLRPYQKQGLNWLASLYNNNTNGILADEMGLGKTIQTISLLAYLACEHHKWGPHLIIVPTSVMLNWEMEFKKFAPGFKVLTYYGSPQQRAQKRKGWNKPDAFHVCITSYQLVVQDQQSFKRRRWTYMILDEAHNIKNFRSTRWRALLNFNTENRLLLTGTPLQNNLMELWSLLYFLMPSSKTSAGNSDLIDENERTTQKMDEETRNTVARLHQVLRPYLLRRLKKDVEKQMPGKYEHIVYCRLSKRQRFLYDDFMSRAKTKETLASGNFLSIINCLMQLRKVCNHPDLFEVRPIVTSFAMPRSIPSYYQTLNLDVTGCENMNYFVCQSTGKLMTTEPFQDQINKLKILLVEFENSDPINYVSYYQRLRREEQAEIKEKLEHVVYLNNLRCGRKPIYGESLLRLLTVNAHDFSDEPYNKYCLTLSGRVDKMNDTIEKYSIITPAAVALDMKDQLIPISTKQRILHEVAENKIDNPFHKAQVKLSIAFPDKTLLQYDCGKLQKLATLLQELTSQGHRALIFTQMTKVLDILEQFLNIHGYRYMRLDGATKIEDRQLLTEKFNRDPKIPVFILSTRSGGLGINLTGADTVIFYDSDWNPAMDKQCQDRCHRIGQVRDVHIYRFVSEYTIESNIIKKANQKRQLDNVVIQEGEFTTDYFGKFSVRDLVSDSNIGKEITDRTIDFSGDAKMGNVLAQAEDEEDRVAAGAALKEVAIDDDDFKEETRSATTGATPAPTETNALSTTDGDAGFIDVDYEDGIGHIDEYMLRFISDGYYL
ncbi:SNF2 N-terminal domain family protein [Candida albicans]|uniref:Helicase SWR1 n=1 Tax=Candida albicans TaxID=5476 RepID=A0A8H6F1C5_CANAX|nr:SNF2 N-terminal domain family protein [Candida albicans]